MTKPLFLSMKVMIRDQEGRYLFLKRSMSSKNNKGMWDLPGGKVDSGESFDEALLREVEEESGLTISLERVAGASESDLPDRKVAYLILEGSHASGEVRLSSEHDDYLWADRKQMAGLDCCPQFKDFVARYFGNTQ